MVNLKTISIMVASTIFSNYLLASESITLEQIDVIAQKSEENAQKVPISLSVFNDISLEDKSISNLKDIAKFTPNLLMFNTGTQSLVTPSIRGISAGVVSYSSPVSLYVDGVPTMNAFGFSDALGDIERIEVLKGPQGTLYGKNSEAGVINIITKKPDNETRGKLFSTFSEDGKKEFGVNLSGPIIENKFYAGISYKHNEKDGYIKHSQTGEDVNNEESDYGKLHLRYTPKDNLDISLIASLNETKDGASDWALAGQKLDNVAVSSNIGHADTKTKTLALNIDYDIDNTTKIKSITTKRVYSEDVATDMDFSASSIRHSFRDYEFDTLSQELRVEKEFGDTKVVSGIYADKEENDIYLVMKTVMDPTGSNSKPQYLTSKTYSFFTNIIHPLNKSWTVNGGIRYDKEKKDIEVSKSNIFIENEWENISPKISLQYDIDKNNMTYATVSKGYRSGGFNPYATTDNYKSYDEESLISYELGYKSMFFNNRVRINSSIYYMDIDDMQVQIMKTPGTSYMVNAASATSKGIEVDMEALVSDEITLFSSFGYNKTTFDKFIDGNNDYSGNYNLHAPKYNFNIGIQYRNDLGYYARADMNGYGKTYFDSANKYSQEAYELVDIKIGYETDDYNIYLYANNLFDKEHHATNAYMNGNVTTYNEGREAGIKLIYRF